MNIKAYNLAILKLNKEKETLENFLKEKNLQKEKLQRIIYEEDRLKSQVNGKLHLQGSVTPEILLVYKNLQHTQKEEILTKIKNIEYEVLMVKNDYLKIKNRLEKIETKKEETIQTLKKEEEKKEQIVAVEQFSIRQLKGG